MVFCLNQHDIGKVSNTLVTTLVHHDHHQLIISLHQFM